MSRRSLAVAAFLALLIPLALTGCSTDPGQAASHAKKCSAEQQLDYLMGVHPETITYVGPFKPAFALDIGATIICAGSYTTSQAGADFPQESIAFVQGSADNQALYAKVDAALTKQGFPPGSSYAPVTSGWDDGQTKVEFRTFLPGTGVIAHVPDDTVLITASPTKP